MVGVRWVGCKVGEGGGGGERMGVCSSFLSFLIYFNNLLHMNYNEEYNIIQNTESLLSMNNIEICLTTA